MSDELRALATRVETTPYPQRLGVRVEEIALDRVRLRVPYKDENSNPGRALHGGVAASTIDVAGTVAAWTGLTASPGIEARTLDLSVNYLSAAIGEDIVAEAKVLRRGKELVYAEVDVRNDGGKPIAKGLVTHRTAAPCAPEREMHAPPAPGAEPDGDVPKLARALVQVPFMASLGLAITHMKDGRSVVEMPAKPELLAGGEALHEGAVAALLDTAGAMASWSVVGLDFTYKASTVGIHVSYHTAARGEDVVAHGRTLRRTDESFLNAVTVVGRRSGRVIATGAVTYRIVVP